MPDELAPPVFTPTTGTEASRLTPLAARAVFWLVAFGICFGLGYATLNRYDPRQTGNVDSAQYYKIVEASPAEAYGHWRHRVLIPYLAKPIHRLTEGRLGSWEPVFFSLLMVNSAFVASTVLVIFLICGMILKDHAVALIASCLYLLNFNVPNLQLAGLVDSGEAFFIAILVWALFKGHWFLLPFLGIAGALSKETFVPLAVGLAGLWWLVEVRRKTSGARKIGWIIAMAILGLATVTVLQSMIEGHTVWPWDIAASEANEAGLVRGLIGALSARTFWYLFIWQLPLTLWQIKKLPPQFVVASVGSAIVALLLGTYNNALGNASRPMFDCAGPLLSIASAMAFVEVGRAMLPARQAVRAGARADGFLS